ncbi:type I 3-dehydroquinate dehydratase [Clostridium sp.]|uniref:type I 3-dehydroquinate dehydratase n=1 Tax=Clostridium sp. TaxID=1506 RepID=UPI00261F4374|nr:type I 3-dehydroquinate dehydratase [Clostridium sp.]
MKKVVIIKDIKIGEGMPKVCVPIVGKSITEIIEEANFIKNIDCDVVEWRGDFFDNIDDISKVKIVLEKIREIINDKPILFTFRSFNEGGEKELSEDLYFELNNTIAKTKLIDIIDVELFKDHKKVKELVKVAHDNFVVVIISNHDFKNTPKKEEIINRLRKASELGADIPKIAVMPNCVEDVINLLDSTRIAKEKYIENPIITISMGDKGIISRLSGELFGSSMTFGIANKASAPGQISVVELRKVLEILNRNL